MGFNVTRRNPLKGSNEDCCAGTEDEEGIGADLTPLCHYKGPEAGLLLGLAWTNVPNWGPEEAAYQWEVDDPSNLDTGKRMKTTQELLPSDDITGVILNKKTLRGHKSLVQDANAGPRREATYEDLAEIAIRNMRQILWNKRRTMVNI